MKQSAAKLEQMLSDAGVPAGSNPPYQTNARSVFAVLADVALKQRQPNTQQQKALVANARKFVGKIWNTIGEQLSDERLPLINDCEIIRGHHRAFFVRDKAQYRKIGRSCIPSIATAEIVTEIIVPDEHMAPGLERARDLISRAEMLMSQLVGEPLKLSLGNDNEPSKWQITVAIWFETYWHPVHHWNLLELVHFADRDLLRWIPSEAIKVKRGLSSYRRSRRQRMEAETNLKAFVEETDLPIRLEVCPTMPGNGWDKDPVAVVLHGYGPAGQALTKRIGDYGIRDLSSPDIHRKLRAGINGQGTLHKRFGPYPGSTHQDWKIDVPTARKLTQLAGGRAAIERVVANPNGKVQIGDITLRISEKRILGQFAVSKDVTWKGDRLQAIGIQLPASVLQGISGRNLSEVVDAEALIGAGTITRATADTIYKRPRMELQIAPSMVPVADLNLE